MTDCGRPLITDRSYRQLVRQGVDERGGGGGREGAQRFVAMTKRLPPPPHPDIHTHARARTHTHTHTHTHILTSHLFVYLYVLRRRPMRGFAGRERRESWVEGGARERGMSESWTGREREGEQLNA